MENSINTTIDADGITRFSGRGLYAFMNAGDAQSFSSFMRHRLKMLKLEKDADYLEVQKWREHEKARSMLEFQLTIDAAIALAEYSRSSKAVNYLTARKSAAQETRLGGDGATLNSEFINARGTEEVADCGLHPIKERQYPATGPGSVIDVTNQKPLTPLQKALMEAAALAEQSEVDSDVKERLVTLESKVDIVLTLFKSAAEALFGLIEPPTANSDNYEEIDLVPTRIDLRHAPIRAQIIGLVNDYVAAHAGVTHHQVWRALYTKLKNEYGVDAWRNKQPKDPSYLEAIERCNQLGNMLKVAVDALVDHPMPNPTRLRSTVNVSQTAQTAEEVNA